MRPFLALSVTVPHFPKWGEKMKKGLIIDDERPITDAFTSAFEEDYEVLVANDGTTGMKLFDEEQPDLLVLDWLLKGNVEGKDVLTYSKDKYPDLPVFVVTASMNFIDEIQSLGADQFLLKPCLDLLQRVQKILG